jgi:hypothetical protein
MAAVPQPSNDRDFTTPQGWKNRELGECIAGLPHQFHIAMQHDGP